MTEPPNVIGTAAQWYQDALARDRATLAALEEELMQLDLRTQAVTAAVHSFRALVKSDEVLVQHLTPTERGTQPDDAKASH
jgi:uncharacterized protein YacL (UPF0231 family)